MESIRTIKKRIGNDVHRDYQVKLVDGVNKKLQDNTELRIEILKNLRSKDLESEEMTADFKRHNKKIVDFAK